MSEKVSIDPVKIGEHLDKLIRAHYPSVRQFARAYLEVQDKPTDRATLQNMVNRFFQILHGNKNIQLADLVICSELLDVTAEELLNGGESYSGGAKRTRLNNATVARSKNPQIWEKYLQTQTVRKVDEYEKTLAEYAVEYQNYELIQFLVKREEIQVWGETEKERQCMGYGATIRCLGLKENRDIWFSIPRELRRGSLNEKLSFHSELREDMILLAIKNKDMEMLRRLRAREIPAQYSATQGWILEWNRESTGILLNALSRADDEILAYFGEEYSICDRWGNEYMWLYPGLDKLLEKLIHDGHPMAESMLETVAEHNHWVYKRLEEVYTRSQSQYAESFFKSAEGREELVERILGDCRTNSDGDWINFVDGDIHNQLTTNLLHLQCAAEDRKIQTLVDEVNQWYEKSCHLKPAVRKLQEVCDD